MDGASLLPVRDLVYKRGLDTCAITVMLMMKWCSEVRFVRLTRLVMIWLMRLPILVGAGFMLISLTVGDVLCIGLERW